MEAYYPRITSCWRFLIFDNPEESMQYCPKQKHQLVFFQTSACCGIWGSCSPGKLHPHASKNPMISMALMIWLRIFQLNKVYQTSHKNPQPTFSLSSLTIPPWRTCFQLFMFGPKAFELEVNWGGEEISGSLPNSTFEETSCCLMVRSVYVYEIQYTLIVVMVVFVLVDCGRISYW